MEPWVGEVTLVLRGGGRCPGARSTIRLPGDEKVVILANRGKIEGTVNTYAVLVAATCPIEVVAVDV